MKTLLGVILFLLAAGVAVAKTDLRFTSGACDGSSWQWWNVQRFEAGRLVEAWGVDCNGKEYHTYGRAVNVDGPLGGAPTETGLCDVGTWYAVTTRLQGVQADCWGSDCSGRYWHFEPDAPSATALSDQLADPVRLMKTGTVYYEQVPMHTEEVGTAIAPGPNAPGVDIH